MARLLWLADVLRAAGLTVHEVPGWRTRGDDSYGPVRGVIIHETRGSATSSDAGEINVLVNGRVGLSGPIAQLYLSRTGDWYVVASGTCHHVKTGWSGPFKGLGNDSLLGIEAQHAESEDWADKPVQYQSYIRGVAAILRHTGWPAPVGHKEHQAGDKPDPEFNMTTFRAQVAAAKGAAFGEDDMSNSWTFVDQPTADQWRISQNAGRDYLSGQARDTVLAIAAGAASDSLAEIRALRATVETMAETIAALAKGQGGNIDVAAILAGVDQRLAVVRADVRDAVADLGEGGAAQVRAES